MIEEPTPWPVRLCVLLALPFVAVGWLVAIPVYLIRRGFTHPDGRY